MPWVRFADRYDERVGSRSFRHHPPRSVAYVRRHVAEHVEDIGAGRKIEAPKGRRSCYDGKIRAR